MTTLENVGTNKNDDIKEKTVWDEAMVRSQRCCLSHASHERIQFNSTSSIGSISATCERVCHGAETRA